MDNFDSILNVNAVNTNDKTSVFAAESKENRNRCYDMSEHMTEKVAADAKSLQTFLDVQSRFDRYTANNALLITAQNPEAQKLGDYGYWREQGAYIKRQEKNNPIFILEPGKEYTRDDGSIGTYYNAKKLYDISQTTLQEKPQQNASIDEKLLIRALISRPPVNISVCEPDKMPENKGAVFVLEDNYIYVRKGMNAKDIFRSLTVELSLAGFANKDKDYYRDGYAFNAYCASYLLCKKYGIETKGYFDFSNAPGYFRGMDNQEVRGELNNIRESASDISLRMSRILEQGRNPNQREHSR